VGSARTLHAHSDTFRNLSLLSPWLPINGRRTMRDKSHVHHQSIDQKIICSTHSPRKENVSHLARYLPPVCHLFGLLGVLCTSLAPQGGVALGAGRSWVFPRGESLARSQSPRQGPTTSPSPRTGGPNVDHFAGLRPSRASSLGLVGRSPCRRFWPAHSGPRCLVSLDQESHAPTPRAQTHMPSRKGHSPQGQAHVAPEPRRRPAIECGCFSFQFVSSAHPRVCHRAWGATYGGHPFSALVSPCALVASLCSTIPS